MGKIKEICNKYRWVVIRILIILFLAILINHYVISDRQIPANNIPVIYKDNLPYADFNSLKLDINQQIQNSIDSGNIIETFFGIIYRGQGLDKLCYQMVNNPDKMIVIFNDSSGHLYEVKNKKCFDATKSIPDLSFELTFTLQPNSSGNLVDKSKCVYYLNESKPCIINGKNYTCNLCLTEGERFVYHTPEIKTYFEANNLHKGIKLFLIFLLTGILLWNLSRVYILIRDGLEKR